MQCASNESDKVAEAVYTGLWAGVPQAVHTSAKMLQRPFPLSNFYRQAVQLPKDTSALLHVRSASHLHRCARLALMTTDLGPP